MAKMITTEELRALSTEDLAEKLKDSKEELFKTLSETIGYDKGDVLQSLLEQGLDPFIMSDQGESLLAFAIRFGSVHCANKLLESEKLTACHINYQDPKEKMTALYLACFYNQPDIVRTLIAKGANRELRHIDGHTPLVTASVKGHLDCVQELLSGLEGEELLYHLNYQNEKSGVTALYLACQEGKHHESFTKVMQ